MHVQNIQLQGSGWVNGMAQAEIGSSAGIADSLLRASHLARITHASKMTTLKFAKITCCSPTI